MLARLMLGVIVAAQVVIGVVAVVKPEWIAIIDRRHKAAGTTSRTGDIELTETYYLVVRIIGVGFILTGVVYGVQVL